MGNFVKLEYCSEIAGSLTEVAKAFVKCPAHSSMKNQGFQHYGNQHSLVSKYFNPFISSHQTENVSNSIPPFHDNYPPRTDALSQENPQCNGNEIHMHRNTHGQEFKKSSESTEGWK